MKLTKGDFPFEEIRTESGDYFASVADALAHPDCKGINNIWSVVESEGTYCFGPAHHWVNLIGYVVTKEGHDGETYYEEAPSMDRCEACDGCGEQEVIHESGAEMLAEWIDCPVCDGCGFHGQEHGA